MLIFPVRCIFNYRREFDKRLIESIVQVCIVKVNCFSGPLGGCTVLSIEARLVGFLHIQLRKVQLKHLLLLYLLNFLSIDNSNAFVCKGAGSVLLQFISGIKGLHSVVIPALILVKVVTEFISTVDLLLALDEFI